LISQCAGLLFPDLPPDCRALSVCAADHHTIDTEGLGSRFQKSQGV
jgi:hypothetical protein